MTSLPYMQLYTSDYLADTAHLTTEEHGAYLLLLMNYWQRAKPLDNSNGRLAHVARLSAERWAAIEPVLAEFFTIDGDTWTQARIERDLDKIRAKSSKLAANGSIGGSKKQANAKQMPIYEEEDKDLTDIYADIEATEDEINEINDMMDIYNLIPQESYGFYSMSQFEVVGNDDLEGAEFAVGTEYEVEKSCREYLDDQFDSPEDYFSESFLENHIDEDEVLDYFRDHYEYDVAENPDVYFNEDDFELTQEQEEKKSKLEEEIAEYEKRQENLDSEIEDPEEYSTMYDQIQEHIDSLQEQIDEMESDGEPSQDMIDDKVEEMLYDVKRNLIDYMKDWGMKISEYINKEDAIQDIIDSDGYGHILNSYDGNYDEVDVDGDNFIVMRVG